ncbi:MAG: nucleoside monophosphate kinase [Chitinophagaceae bacterium]|nr:nucleoside monophosphate kinase [Chitinophagaceae bacterium]
MLLSKSIIVLGQIGSGKTTVARQLSSSANIPMVSFGEYLRYYLKDVLKIEINRKNLQDTGQALIENDPVEFLNNVISFNTFDPKEIIFDGVRHKTILESLKKISKKVVIICVDVPDNIRLKRVVNRDDGIDANSAAKLFNVANAHPVEKEIKEMMRDCDYHIDNSKEIENLIAQLNSITL